MVLQQLTHKNSIFVVHNYARSLVIARQDLSHLESQTRVLVPMVAIATVKTARTSQHASQAGMHLC